VTWLLSLLLGLGPYESAAIASAITGARVDDLVAVCWRESRCQRIGVHHIDAHRDGWGGQVRLGHLRAVCQPRGSRARWTTRGPWGLSAAAHWPYMPACYQPEVLDVPLASAVIAGRKMVRECYRRGPRGSWCPRRTRRAGR
jgi:hypothetical protein